MTTKNVTLASDEVRDSVGNGPEAERARDVDHDAVEAYKKQMEDGTWRMTDKPLVMG
jgi:hypothetical protein